MNYSVLVADYYFAYNKSRISPSNIFQANFSLTEQENLEGLILSWNKQTNKQTGNFNKMIAVSPHTLSRCFPAMALGSKVQPRPLSWQAQRAQWFQYRGLGTRSASRSRNRFSPINNVFLWCRNLFAAKETKEPAERSFMYSNADAGYWPPPPHVLYVCHRSGGRTILCVVIIMDSAL